MICMFFDCFYGYFDWIIICNCYKIVISIDKCKICKKEMLYG